LAAGLSRSFFAFGSLAASRAEELAKDQVEFFEKKIRPVLVEHCYECHSAQSDKLKGKLLLDNREASLKGGRKRPRGCAREARGKPCAAGSALRKL